MYFWVKQKSEKQLIKAYLNHGVHYRSLRLIIIIVIIITPEIVYFMVLTSPQQYCRCNSFHFEGKSSKWVKLTDVIVGRRKLLVNMDA